MRDQMQEQESAVHRIVRQDKNNGSVFLGFTPSLAILGGGYGLIYVLNGGRTDASRPFMPDGTSVCLFATPIFVFISVCTWLLIQKRGRSLMGMMIGVALAGVLFFALLVLLMAACFGLI